MSFGVLMDPAEVFMVEAKVAAILDTAWTKTVCGQKWLDDYQNKIGKDIQSTPSQKEFRFGDGKVIKSSQIVTIPACIGSTECKIMTEVVKADIPRLLSKSSLQKAGTVLD